MFQLDFLSPFSVLFFPDISDGSRGSNTSDLPSPPVFIARPSIRWGEVRCKMPILTTRENIQFFSPAICWKARVASSSKKSFAVEGGIVFFILLYANLSGNPGRRERELWGHRRRRRRWGPSPCHLRQTSKGRRRRRTAREAIPWARAFVSISLVTLDLKLCTFVFSECLPDHQVSGKWRHENKTALFLH